MSASLVITLYEFPSINYFLQKNVAQSLGRFSYFLYLCTRIGLTKTENFLEIRRRKVVQNGKPSDETRADKFT